MFYIMIVFVYTSVYPAPWGRGTLYRQGAKECAYIEIAGG